MAVMEEPGNDEATMCVCSTMFVVVLMGATVICASLSLVALFLAVPPDYVHA